MRPASRHGSSRAGKQAVIMRAVSRGQVGRVACGGAGSYHPTVAGRPAAGNRMGRHAGTRGSRGSPPVRLSSPEPSELVLVGQPQWELVAQGVVRDAGQLTESLV